MNNLDAQIIDYLTHCEFQKRLNSKTLKAYKIDLRQFSEFIHISDVADVSSSVLETYISKLHQLYKPKTVKRKIASVKAFFHYLEYKEIITINPFNKIQIKFRELQIPLHRITDSASNGSVFPVVTEHFSASSDHAFL